MSPHSRIFQNPGHHLRPVWPDSGQTLATPIQAQKLTKTHGFLYQNTQGNETYRMTQSIVPTVTEIQIPVNRKFSDHWLNHS